MFVGRWINQQFRSSVCARLWLAIRPVSLGLAIVFGASPCYAENIDASPTWQPDAEFGVAMPVADSKPSNAAGKVAASADKYWAFPSGGQTTAGGASTALTLLPPIDERAEASDVNANLVPDEFVARLLPPQALPTPPGDLPIPLPEITPTPRVAERLIRRIEPTSQHPIEVPPVLGELSDQERALANMLRDASSATTGVLTDHRINELAKKKIQHAYAMAGRGSHYVARRELIEVLRMLSQAKDAMQGSRDRTLALSAGLRALREAEDFVPRGTQLEAELDVETLRASHRTPVAREIEVADLPPRLLMDRYLRYAQLQLAMSVAGEPAGSMALHALGKINSQLGQVEPENHRLSDRRAIAYQQAALLAHNQNHLAAHELGVLLARSGHFAESQQLLQQVAVREPNAIVLANLARVQQELGQTAQANSNREYSQQLKQQGATGTRVVEWVSPTRFAEVGAQPARYSTAQRTPASQSPAAHSQNVSHPNLRR